MGLTKKQEQYNKCDYTGGHPSHPGSHSGGVMVLDKDGVHYRKLREVFCIPWSEVTNYEVEGPDQAQRRVTFTRVVALGLFAFAAKKKEGEAFVTVDTADYSVGFRLPKTGVGEVQAASASMRHPSRR